MKKIMLAAIAALAITGCSQSEEFESMGQESEINFNTAVTRATVLTTTGFKAFEAYGYAHSGSEAFSANTSGTEILKGSFTYDNTAWAEKDGNKFYWPVADKVAFFAYSPAVGAGKYVKAETGFPTVEYTVNSDIAQQADFVVAQEANKGKAESVALSFKHALTQVIFKLKGDDNTLTYKVTGVKLKNILPTGVYSYEKNSWVASGTATDYTLTIPANFAVNGATAQLLNAADQLLILMPQTLTNATVEVDYSVEKSGVPLLNATKKSANITGTWGTGEKYVYSLTLSGGEEIKLTGTVDDSSWTGKVEQEPALAK